MLARFRYNFNCFPIGPADWEWRVKLSQYAKCMANGSIRVGCSGDVVVYGAGILIGRGRTDGRRGHSIEVLENRCDVTEQVTFVCTLPVTRPRRQRHSTNSKRSKGETLVDERGGTIWWRQFSWIIHSMVCATLGAASSSATLFQCNGIANIRITFDTTRIPRPCINAYTESLTLYMYTI